MTAYADTSFVASLYAPDTNSVAAAARMAGVGLPVLMTSLGELELINAFHLRLFRKELRAKEVKAASSAFRADVNAGVFDLRAVGPETYVRALRLARRHTPRLGTRSLDILHVAAALTLGAESFLTFDLVQRRLAQAEGLTV